MFKKAVALSTFRTVNAFSQSRFVWIISAKALPCLSVLLHHYTADSPHVSALPAAAKSHQIELVPHEASDIFEHIALFNECT